MRSLVVQEVTGMEVEEVKKTDVEDGVVEGVEGAQVQAGETTACMSPGIAQ